MKEYSPQSNSCTSRYNSADENDSSLLTTLINGPPGSNKTLSQFIFIRDAEITEYIFYSLVAAASALPRLTIRRREALKLETALSDGELVNRDLENFLIVIVGRHNAQAILHGVSRNPDIVRGDQYAGVSEKVKNDGVSPSRGEIVYSDSAEKPFIHPSRASGRTEERLKSLVIFRSC